MRKSMVIFPAPSIFAASSMLSGIAANPVRRTIRLYVFIAPGMISAQSVSNMENDLNVNVPFDIHGRTTAKFLTAKYVGIRPPLKNIVKMMKNDMAFATEPFSAIESMRRHR